MDFNKHCCQNSVLEENFGGDWGELVLSPISGGQPVVGEDETSELGN